MKGHFSTAGQVGLTEATSACLLQHCIVLCVLLVYIGKGKEMVLNHMFSLLCTANGTKGQINVWFWVICMLKTKDLSLNEGDILTVINNFMVCKNIVGILTFNN